MKGIITYSLHFHISPIPTYIPLSVYASTDQYTQVSTETSGTDQLPDASPGNQYVYFAGTVGVGRVHRGADNRPNWTSAAAVLCHVGIQCKQGSS